MSEELKRTNELLDELTVYLNKTVENVNKGCKKLDEIQESLQISTKTLKIQNLQTKINSLQEDFKNSNGDEQDAIREKLEKLILQREALEKELDSLNE